MKQTLGFHICFLLPQHVWHFVQGKKVWEQIFSEYETFLGNFINTVSKCMKREWGALEQKSLYHIRKKAVGRMTSYLEEKPLAAWLVFSSSRRCSSSLATIFLAGFHGPMMNRPSLIDGTRGALRRSNGHNHFFSNSNIEVGSLYIFRAYNNRVVVQYIWMKGFFG